MGSQYSAELHNALMRHLTPPPFPSTLSAATLDLLGTLRAILTSMPITEEMRSGIRLDEVKSSAFQGKRLNAFKAPAREDVLLRSGVDIMLAALQRALRTSHDESEE